jgi:RHS repeat-associated protein
VNYQYDANGNLVQENANKHLEWDYADQMIGFVDQAGSQVSVEARYVYDAAGQRVKKWAKESGGQSVTSTVYMDGIYEAYTWEENQQKRVSSYAHVMDNQQRVAMLRSGDIHPKEASPNVQYTLGDHLGSSQVVVDETGSWINREEYTAFGETSFGGFAKKRYRYTGKERDEESGYYYHGARYYAPWLCRWASTDPEGMKDGVSAYVYVKNNPLILVDKNGKEAGTQDQKQQNKQTPEQIMKNNINQQRLHQAATRGKWEENETMPVVREYNSKKDQMIDKPEDTLSYIPGFKTGWALGEALEGKTLSDKPVNRLGKLFEAGLNLAQDVATLELGAGVLKSAGTAVRSFSQYVKGVPLAEQLAAMPGTTRTVGRVELLNPDMTITKVPVVARTKGNIVSFDTPVAEEALANAVDIIQDKYQLGRVIIGTGTHGTESGLTTIQLKNLADRGFYLADVKKLAKAPISPNYHILDLSDPVQAEFFKAMEQAAQTMPEGTLTVIRGWCFSTVSKL